MILGLDIIIDEEAFNTAVNDMRSLEQKLQALRNDTEDMINTLKTGWDTPAGRKFVASCEKNLYKPLDDQKLVLQHISDTLNDSRTAYQSVFSEYQDLQNTIKKAQ
jgi:uncharacterized protein YukE